MAKKEFDPINRGSLRKNKNKVEKWHADLKGKINVEGTEHWLDGWLQTFTGEDGAEERVISIKIGAEVQPRAAPAQYPARAAASDARPALVMCEMPDGSVKQVDAQLAKQLGLKLVPNMGAPATRYTDPDDDIPF